MSSSMCFGDTSEKARSRTQTPLIYLEGSDVSFSFSGFGGSDSGELSHHLSTESLVRTGASVGHHARGSGWASPVTAALAWSRVMHQSRTWSRPRPQRNGYKRTCVCLLFRIHGSPIFLGHERSGCIQL